MMLKKYSLMMGMSLCASLSFAANCSTDLKGTDKMSFTDKKGKTVSQIIVPASCTTFKINLEHNGEMSVKQMGHNIVISKASDVASVVKDGRQHKEHDYVNPNDSRVIAYSKMIGGGQKTSVEFPVAKIKAGGYKFFCSFPMHSVRMSGDLIVK